jgi:hypothetical protein
MTDMLKGEMTGTTTRLKCDPVKTWPASQLRQAMSAPSQKDDFSANSEPSVAQENRLGFSLCASRFGDVTLCGLPLSSNPQSETCPRLRSGIQNPKSEYSSPKIYKVKHVFLCHLCHIPSRNRAKSRVFCLHKSLSILHFQTQFHFSLFTLHSSPFFLCHACVICVISLCAKGLQRKTGECDPLCLLFSL